MKILLCICLFICILLTIKIISLKKSVRQVRADFFARSEENTNAMIGISTNDSDIKELVSDMNQAIDKMRKAYHIYEQGNAEMQTAITNISHDIRTPLTAISGYLELLKPMEKSEEVEKYLNIIEERTKHMRKLTEELFEYSMITSKSENEIQLEDVELNRALEECIIEYYGALTEKNIDLTVEMTEEKIICRLGKTEVDRIFSNLISNALKYSDGDLKIELREDGVICFSNRADKLSELAVERLFGRFYTVENARNSTGLGLSIAKTFTERMGGKIEAEYKLGRLYIILTFS